MQAHYLFVLFSSTRSNSPGALLYGATRRKMQCSGPQKQLHNAFLPTFCTNLTRSSTHMENRTHTHAITCCAGHLPPGSILCIMTAEQAIVTKTTTPFSTIMAGLHIVQDCSHICCHLTTAQERCTTLRQICGTSAVQHCRMCQLHVKMHERRTASAHCSCARTRCCPSLQQQTKAAVLCCVAFNGPL